MGLISGTLFIERSKEFIAAGKPYNKELIDPIFPYLEWFIYIHIMSRLVMMIASYWWFNITKFYLYYEIFYLCVIFTLPNDYGIVLVSTRTEIMYL